MDQPNVHNYKLGDSKRAARHHRKFATGIDFSITRAERAHELRSKKHARLRRRLEDEERPTRAVQQLPDLFAAAPDWSCEAVGILYKALY